MGKEIKQMFSQIHKSYDTMNHLLSLGIDIFWRKAAAQESIVAKRNYKLLDIATGTGDLAIMIKRLGAQEGKQIDVHGVDFNTDMLHIAERKASDLKLKIHFKVGDALKLTYKNNSFDMVASAFALRDFDSLQMFASESFRVLRKGGKLVLLEMAKPEKLFPRLFFRFYTKVMLAEGSLVNKEAYRFLVNSIIGFDKSRLIAILEKTGFKRVRAKSLVSGAAFIFTAYK